MSTKIKSTKTWQLLLGLSGEERRRFRRFLESPSGPGRSEVLRLYQSWERALAAGLPEPDKYRVFTRVFGSGAYDDHRLRMASSFLRQAACDFLTLEDFRADMPAFYLRQAEILRKRGLESAASSALEKAEKRMLEQHYRNVRHEELAYTVELERYRLSMSDPAAQPLQLDRMRAGLDAAYLSRYFWQWCFAWSHRTRSGVLPEDPTMEALLGIMPGHPALAHPAVSIYYYCYMALRHPEESAYYRRFKTALMELGDLFLKDELRDLYILALNFCIRQYNSGIKDYLREQFDLYRTGLGNGYFMVEGSLSQYTYQNAATVALVLNELGWLERFIDQYRAMLHPAYRESMYSFNLARLQYARKDYQAALLLLQKADYKDILLGLAAKALQMKVYFALDAYDLLESHLQALAAYLNRHKELSYHRENYRNTLRFTRRLLETPRADRVARERLRAEIEQTGAVAEKEWLLEQLR